MIKASILVFVIGALFQLFITCGVYADSHSIAIMNFTNRNPGDRWDWLEKGIADMLITDLSEARELQVVERERMQEIFEEMELSKKGIIDPVTAQKFGRTAKVGWALFGSFLVKSERVEIEAHIIEVETQEIIRVEWVKGEAKDVLNLEKELALNIIKNMYIKVTNEEIASIKYVPTDNLEAAERFYIGIDFMDKGEEPRALAEFKRAFKKDPSYGKAGFWIGKMYHDMEEYEHAVIAYKDMINKCPDTPWTDDALYNLAKIGIEIHDDEDEANIYYCKIFEKFQDSPYFKISAVKIAESLIKKDKLLELYKLYLTFKEKNEKIGKDTTFDLQKGTSPFPYRYHPINVYVKLCEEGYENLPPPEGEVITAPETRPEHFAYTIEKHNINPELSDLRKIFVAPLGYYMDKIHIYMKSEIDYKYYDYAKGSFKEEVRRYYWQREEKNIHLGIYNVLKPEEEDRSGVSINIKGEGIYSDDKIYIPEKPRKAIHLDLSNDAGLYIHDLKIAFYLIKYTPENKKAACPEGSIQSVEITSQKDKFIFERIEKIGPYAKNAVKIKGKDSLTRPTVTRTRDGRLWMAFVVRDKESWMGLYTKSIELDSDIYLTSSYDGLNWEKPWRLSINSSEDDYHPRLWQHPDGTLCMLWLSGRKIENKFHAYVSSSENGIDWYAARICNIQPDKENIKEEHFYYYPIDIIIGNKGDIYLLRLDCEYSNELTLLSSSDNGLNWEVVSEVFRSGKGKLPIYIDPRPPKREWTNGPGLDCDMDRSFLLDNNGILRIVWPTFHGPHLYLSSGFEDISKKENRSLSEITKQWEPWKPLGDTIVRYNFRFPKILRLKTGKYIIAYELQSKGYSINAGIMMRISDDLINWSKAVRIDSIGIRIDLGGLDILPLEEENYLMVYSMIPHMGTLLDIVIEKLDLKGIIETNLLK